MAPSDQILEQDLRDAVRDMWKIDPGLVTVNAARRRVEEKHDLDTGFFVDPNLQGGNWKDRSKKIIKDECEVRQNEDEEADQGNGTKEEDGDTKNGVKRSSSEEQSPKPNKRQKKSTKQEGSDSALSDQDDIDQKPTKRSSTKNAAAQKNSKKSVSDSDLSDLASSEEDSKKKSNGKKKAKRVTKPTTAKRASTSRAKAKKESSDESELSDLSDSALEDDHSEDEKPPKKNKKKASAPKRKSKKPIDSESDADEDDFKEESSSSDRKRKRSASAPKGDKKRAKVESESEDDLIETKESSLEATKKPQIKKEKKKAANKPAKTEDSDEDMKAESDEDDTQKKVNKDEINSDSELSSVLDEPPPPKKSKGKTSKESKTAKPKASASKVVKDLSPDEAEVKKLQGQLVKCGLRKIWGIELKKYGDDNRAKIRHLKGMLADLGMEGRFSEAKAKEIKERRELMADLDAVNEMNDLWGHDNGRGRASRSRAPRKSLKEDSDEEDVKMKDEGDDDEEVDPEAQSKARISKRQADLAFLGDDSESE